MDSVVLIENMAEEFWALAGGAPKGLRVIKMAITLTLPLELYGVAGLRVSDVIAWMKRVQIAYRIRGRNRRLHGCLIADQGKGTIFFDTDDPGDEQRFSLAHELAHFLLDYSAPRQRALAILGPSILPVLDGERAPTEAERVHAVLSAVPLGVMSHFMERPEHGLPGNIILDIEDRADRLALELLAPAAELQALLRQAGAPRGYTARLTYAQKVLSEEYGLPEDIASGYARYLLAQLGEPSFRDWLFGNVG